MRTKKALYNTMASLALQIVTFIAGIILPRLLITTYGSSINGLRTSIAQIINYFYVFEIGIGGAVMFALYKPLATKDYDLVNGIVSAAKKEYKKVGIVFIVLVILLAYIYPKIISGENIDQFTIIFLTLSIGATGIINYFLTSSYTTLISASQLGYINSIARIIYISINTLIIVVLVKLELNIGIVYFISILANIINATFIRRYIKNKFKYLKSKSKANMQALSKRFDVVYHQISGLIVSSIPVLYLTLFVDLKTVSVYSVYYMIFSGIGMVISVVGNSFSAGFGDLIAKKETSNLKEAYSQYEFIYYGMITFVYSCTLVLGIPFLKIYLKGIADANYIEYSILLLFSAVGIVTNWKVPQSIIIISAGHYRETRHRAIIEAIIIVLTSIPLVLIFGLKGVLAGSLLGLLYRSLDIFYATKITAHEINTTLKRIARMIFIVVITNIPFIRLIQVEVNNLAMWILYSLLVSIWVGFVALIVNLIFERPIIIRIIKRLRVVVHTIKN